jgi:lipoyl synthase
MRPRLPPWFTVKLGQGEKFREVSRALAAQGLHTVCSSARCPNMGECWSSGTATFMILGDVCTRNCGFCAVPHGKPDPLDFEEPVHVSHAAQALNLSYVVVTSVTRDDIEDGGASIFAETIHQLRRDIPGVKVEVLIPDFQGDHNALKTVLDANPDVLNHNIETVPRLYPDMRPQANYSRSLELLDRTTSVLGETRTKSGLMLGMGESPEEVTDVLTDLRNAGTGRLTLGQYLQPTRHHRPVGRYLPPEEFDMWKSRALSMGFAYVASGPLVRSSYHADEMDSSPDAI